MNSITVYEKHEAKYGFLGRVQEERDQKKSVPVGTLDTTFERTVTTSESTLTPLAVSIRECGCTASQNASGAPVSLKPDVAMNIPEKKTSRA